MPGVAHTGSNTGFVPWYPAQRSDPILGECPWDWAGTTDVGTAQIFTDAPLGSRYTRVTGPGTVDLYVKDTNANNSSADWTIATNA